MSSEPRAISSLAGNAAHSARWFRSARHVFGAAPWVVTASVIGLLAFAGLAHLVQNGGTLVIDEHILMALRSAADSAVPIGPKWLAGYMRDVTALGGFAVLSIVVIGVAGFLAAIGRQRLALRIFAISLSGWLLTHAVKFVFMRPRPDLVPHGAEVYATSFPSGHAMTSAVVYLTLGAALAGATDDLKAKSYVICLAIALTAVIGFSRVYLGVHWPTDVLGGWVLGATWVGFAWYFFSRADHDAKLGTGAKTG